MSDNRISASLAQADRDAVMKAIATIREKLPFLVDLTTEERRSLPKMGVIKSGREEVKNLKG